MAPPFGGLVRSTRVTAEARTGALAGRPTIEQLGAADRPRAVAGLARAFRDNPLNVAVIGGRGPARRDRANAAGMRSLIPVAERRGFVRAARLSGEIVALLIASPPYRYPLPPPAPAARLRTLLVQGLRVARRWRVVFEALDALHPPEPTWYLGTLGVHPAHQRRGIGRALVEDWLRRVDAEGQRGYLETDRPESVDFYRRVDFTVEGETEVLGVPIWRMGRPPSGSVPLSP